MMAIGDISDRAGVDRTTIGLWRKRTNPHIGSFDACLGVLGYKLAIVRVHDVADDPPTTRSDLAPNYIRKPYRSRQLVSGA